MLWVCRRIIRIVLSLVQIVEKSATGLGCTFVAKYIGTASICCRCEDTLRLCAGGGRGRGLWFAGTECETT